MERLHLGCGSNVHRHWVNIDGSWNAWLSQHRILRWFFRVLRLVPQHLLGVKWGANVLVRDLRKPLPFPDNSVSVIYASHLLGHLWLNQADALLRECYRVLKPGGVLRIMVPDLAESVSHYVTKTYKTDEMPNADCFMRDLQMRDMESPVGNIFYRFYIVLKDYRTQKWKFDEESLVWHFKKSGFADAQRMPLHISKIPEIESIERNKGLCVEGTKC